MGLPRALPVLLATLMISGCEGSASNPGRDASTTPLPPPGPLPATCETDVTLRDVSAPTATVGDGTAASCDEVALRAAVTSGGTVVFDCGSEPVRITLTSALEITEDTVIDGGGMVTLSGGGTNRILTIQGSFEATSPHLVVQNLSFVDGRGAGEHTAGGGGAIFYRGGRVTVIDSHFENNRCVENGPDVAGGAIYGMGLGETIVVGSRFVSNVGSSGGAIGALGTAITIVNSELTRNRASGEVDMGGNGGAVYMDGQGRTLSVCGTRFIENESNALGGAMFRTGYETEPNPIHLSVFDSNSSTDGPRESSAGAFYLQGVNVVVSGTTISNNRAAGGAGIRIESHGPGATGRLEMTNCTLANNRTYERDDFTTRGVGAGIGMGEGTEGFLRNVTVVGNAAQFGAGIWNPSRLTITNSIIANEADNEWTPLNCGPDGSAAGQHNLQWPMGREGSDNECVTGIAFADPVLGALADHGGAAMTMMPLAGSPAIGAGRDCPETDQRGRPRDTTSCTLGAVEAE